MCVHVLGGKGCYLVPWFPAPSWEPDWKKRRGCDCGFIVFVSWCCHVSFSAMDLDNYVYFIILALYLLSGVQAQDG